MPRHFTSSSPATTFVPANRRACKVSHWRDWPQAPESGTLFAVPTDAAKDVSEWATAWLAASTAESDLTSMLHSEVMVDVNNRALAFLRRAFSPASSSRITGVPLDSTSRARRVALAKQLYSACLKHELAAEAALGATSSEIVAALSSPRLTSGLLAVVAEVSAFACNPMCGYLYPQVSAAAGSIGEALAAWTAIPVAASALGGSGRSAVAVGGCSAIGTTPAPPRPLLDALGFMTIRIEEEVLWGAGSDAYSAMAAVYGGGASSELAESVDAALRAAARRLADRTARAARILASKGNPPMPENYEGLCVGLVNKLMERGFDLLFGQHASVVSSCVLYGVARSTGHSVRFRAAERAVATAAPHIDPGVFGSDAAELSPPTPREPRGVRGEARELYNGPFLERAREMLEAMAVEAGNGGEKEKEEAAVAAAAVAAAGEKEKEKLEERAGRRGAVAPGNRLAKRRKKEAGKEQQEQQQQKQQQKQKRRVSFSIAGGGAPFGGKGKGKGGGGREEEEDVEELSEGEEEEAGATAPAPSLQQKQPQQQKAAGIGGLRVPLSAMTAADVERRELAARRAERGGVSVAFTPNSKVRYDRGSRGGGDGSGGGGGAKGRKGNNNNNNNGNGSGGGAERKKQPQPPPPPPRVRGIPNMTPMRE